MSKVLTPEQLETNCNVPGLWRVRQTDMPRLARILENAYRVRELWDDEALANPGPWFMSHYMSPNNMLFDVLDGAGLVAFVRTIPGWRSQVYAAAWKRRAMGRDDLFRAAMQIAMLTNDLLVLDSFVVLDNKISQRATLRAGFVNRGTIANGQCYNGVYRPVYWNEIDRAELGLGD